MNVPPQTPFCLKLDGCRSHGYVIGWTPYSTTSKYTRGHHVVTIHPLRTSPTWWNVSWQTSIRNRMNVDLTAPRLDRPFSPARQTIVHVDATSSHYANPATLMKPGDGAYTPALIFPPLHLHFVLLLLLSSVNGSSPFSTLLIIRPNLFFCCRYWRGSVGVWIQYV